MILVDTDPLVASLIRKTPNMHVICEVLHTLQEPLCTTVAVLTEAFHMLSAGSHGADRLRKFIGRGGLAVWFYVERPLKQDP